MRITHVVTLVSDDGAYGGPVSVATGQLATLAGRGHHVELVSLWRGAGPPPTAVDGVPLRAHRAWPVLPGWGFLGLFHPLLALTLWRRAGRPGLLHLHAGRDLVSLAALLVAVMRRRPFVVQPHGMVQPRRGALAFCFDLLYRPLLRRARAVLALTRQEEAGLIRVLGGAPLPPVVRLPNGVSTPRDAATGGTPEGGTPPLGPARPVRRGAGSGGEGADVLFLARLHARKRPEAFVRMAALVRRCRPGVSFALHGADEGVLAEVLRLIETEGVGGRVRYGGPLDHAAALARIARATVYVLPSVEEPFPMTVLEALAAGTPVVCTDSCGIADDLAAAGAALVTDGSPRSLADAVVRLLDNDGLRARLTAAGHTAVSDRFSLSAVVDRLERLYGEAVG